MEKYALKKFIKRKLNIPITPENVYTCAGVGKHDAKRDARVNADTKYVKYIDELYSAAFMDDYFSQADAPALPAVL